MPGSTSTVGDGGAEGGGTEALRDDEVAECEEWVLDAVAAPFEQAASSTRATARPTGRMRRTIVVPPQENALVDDATMLRAAADRLTDTAVRSTAGDWRISGLLASRPEVVA